MENTNFSQCNNKQILNEVTRRQLLNKSRNADNYKDTSKGKNRYARRTKSRIPNQVRNYNKLDMDSFFKKDILSLNIDVQGETNNYEVKVQFKNVLKEIQREVKVNNNKLEFRTVIQSLLRIFNSNDVFISCTCLHPDTRIRLADDSTPTVVELCERYSKGEDLKILASDSKGNMRKGSIEKVWVTGVTNKFIKITLENGNTILTTPNHPYMMDDGVYILAENLKIDDAIMAINYDCESEEKNVHIIKAKEQIELDEPIEVYDIKVKRWNNFLTEAGAILHNCPDWKYTQAYFATQQKYNSGEPQNSNGKAIRNPHDTKGGGCKHILLVLSNMDWMMKISSVIYNYINYAKEHLQNMYAKFIFPVIYGRPYDKEVQMSFDDYDQEGNIVTDIRNRASDIDVANKWARDRVKFQKGNKMGIRFAKNEPEEKEQPQLNVKLGQPRDRHLVNEPNSTNTTTNAHGTSIKK